MNDGDNGGKPFARLAKSKSPRISRRAAMSVLLGAAIVLCAFFTRIYQAMPWDGEMMAGMPLYQLKQSVASGFFAAAGCGVMIAAGCVFWLLLTPLTGARWSQSIRPVWFRVAESGMAAWMFVFCVVGCMPNVLFPWMECLQKMDPRFLWSWGCCGMKEYLSNHGMEQLAGRVWLVNMPFFFTREFLCGVLLVLVPAVWKIRFESGGDHSSLHQRKERMRRACSALALPVVVIAVGLAGVDWMNPSGLEWMPSLVPVVILSSSAVMGLGASYYALLFYSRQGCVLPVSRMGAMLLAALMFKIYLWYSLYMLVWYADLPREVSFFTPRLAGDWGLVAAVCSWGNLVLLLALLVPFVRRTKRVLFPVGGLIALLGCIEVYWILASVRGVSSPCGVTGIVFLVSLMLVAVFMALLAASWKKGGDSMNNNSMVDSRENG